MTRRLFLSGCAAVAAASQPQAFQAGIVPAGRNNGTPVETFWRNCDAVAQLGFHRIEVNDTRLGIDLSYEGRESEFSEGMKSRGLTLAGMALFSRMAEASQREETLARHMRAGRFLKLAGGHYITHMLAVGDVLNEPADAAAYGAVDIGLWARHANEAGKRLREEHGIALAYHPEQGEIRSGLFARILDAADERYLRLLIDTGHVASGGAEPAALCRQYRSRLACVHLKDFDPALTPRKAGNAQPGQGAANLPAVVEALRDVGFEGYLMGEGGATDLAWRDYMTGPLRLTV